MNGSWIRVGAIAAFLAVALGAFGAHALKDTLVAHGRVDTWETATTYHLVHALALLLPAVQQTHKRLACIFFTLGILIFSGSLYILCLTNITWLGAITPLGGVSFLAGWLVTAFQAKDR